MTAKDHKRKSRPIAPATVTVEPGVITVVVPDVLGKNEAHVSGAPRKDGRTRFVSGATKRYRESVLQGTCALPIRTIQEFFKSGLENHFAGEGAWRLEVLGVWPTENHQVGFVAPRGDADAAIPQALDALQHAGILDDDARVVEVRAWNKYVKGVRATVMRLVRVSNESPTHLPYRDTAVAHLLPLVPQSPEPPAKPARKRKAKPCA